VKEILYDWFGLNTYLFKLVNYTFGHSELDSLMIFGDIVGGHHYAQYHITALVSLALYSIYQKRGDRVVFKNAILYWADILATLPLALGLSYAVIYALKDTFAFPRPFCTEGLLDVHTIPFIVNGVNCNTSFPSGHFAFSTTFLATLWPVLSTRLKYVLSSALLFVGISRMAAGVHYPADLFLSFLICVPLVLYTRTTLYWFTKKFYVTLVKHVPTWDEITSKFGIWFTQKFL
jgi:signal peptidase II